VKSNSLQEAVTPPCLLALSVHVVMSSYTLLFLLAVHACLLSMSIILTQCTHASWAPW